MEKLLKDRINLTIENYRNAKEDLRNDGDLINHFASLVFTHYEKEIPFHQGFHLLEGTCFIFYLY